MRSSRSFLPIQLLSQKHMLIKRKVRLKGWCGSVVKNTDVIYEVQFPVYTGQLTTI